MCGRWVERCGGDDVGDGGGGRVQGHCLLLEPCFDDFEGLEENAGNKAAEAARNEVLCRHCVQRSCPALLQWYYLWNLDWPRGHRDGGDIDKNFLMEKVDDAVN
jgi:hypothetical protein